MKFVLLLIMIISILNAIQGWASLNPLFQTCGIYRLRGILKYETLKSGIILCNLVIGPETQSETSLNIPNCLTAKDFKGRWMEGIFSVSSLNPLAARLTEGTIRRVLPDFSIQSVHKIQDHACAQ